MRQPGASAAFSSRAAPCCPVAWVDPTTVAIRLVSRLASESGLNRHQPYTEELGSGMREIRPRKADLHTGWKDHLRDHQLDRAVQSITPDSTRSWRAAMAKPVKVARPPVVAFSEESVEASLKKVVAASRAPQDAARIFARLRKVHQGQVVALCGSVSGNRF